MDLCRTLDSLCNPVVGRFDFRNIEIANLCFGEGLANNDHCFFPFFVSNHSDSLDIAEVFTAEFQIFSGCS